MKTYHNEASGITKIASNFFCSFSDKVDSFDTPLFGNICHCDLVVDI